MKKKYLLQARVRTRVNEEMLYRCYWIAREFYRSAKYIIEEY